MVDNNDFERRVRELDRHVRELDGHLRELEQRIAAGEVTSQPVLDMARGMRKALDHYFQSGNNGGQVPGS
jgi:hypothetical protein